MPERRFVSFEAQYGGRPDHAILQSWVDLPDYALPETTPSTFTWLVNRYRRRRAALTLRAATRTITGRLADDSGEPGMRLFRPSDFALYDVRYTESSDTVNRVANPSFVQGLAGWAVGGDASIALEPSDRGTGSMLHVRAAPTWASCLLTRRGRLLTARFRSRRGQPRTP